MKESEYRRQQNILVSSAHQCTTSPPQSKPSVSRPQPFLLTFPARCLIFIFMNALRTHLARVQDRLRRLPWHALSTRLVSLFQRLPWKSVGAGLGILGFLAVFGMGLAYSDYRTNWMARRLGTMLADANALRPQTGAVWQRIQAHEQTRETIDPGDIPVGDLQAGLPEAVRRNRFEMERTPDFGAPGYVALWKTPTRQDVNDRSLEDITSSLRIYRQGLAIVEALHLPDARFHPQVRTQVENLYAQLGDLGALMPDTLMGVAGDTLMTLAPDSVKAAVFSEIAADIIPGLKAREKAALARDYKAGRIAQIFLHRDLGRYRGELHRDNDIIEFDIDAEAMARILTLPIANP